ncbi:MAG: ACP S-malonyltransferase [Geminicoccaceae bacterium]
MRAFVFPGQGSQAVGMGKDLAAESAAARQVIEEVNDALGEDLGKLMAEGPADQLTLTANAQPALMTVSIAAMRMLEREGAVHLADLASHVAGHSLGEYSALVAVGTLELADAARLLRLRGEAMQRAVPVGEGAMAAILGLELEQVEALVAEVPEGQVCAIANDNAPGQVVVSGHEAAVEALVDAARGQGARRSMMLQVSAPFHCALMQPAAETMAEALAETAFAEPAVPLIANVNAAPTSDPGTIRKQLVDQVTSRVRWRETMLSLPPLGVSALVEAGSGKVLSGLAKRTIKDVPAQSLQGPDDIRSFLEAL